MAGSFLEDDLTHMFASSDFGEADCSVRWKGTIDVSGAIFDDEDVEVNLGEGPTSIIRQAIVTAPSAQFTTHGGIARNQAMRVRDVDYRIQSWMDDGTGVVEIMLERTS